MRLALLPGLLEEHHAQSLRARQRRARMASDPGQSLRALEVMDRSIDRALLAASFYGDQARELFAARCADVPGAQRPAAVFLHLALSTHTRARDLLEQVRRHWSEHPREVLEALWFYPVSTGPFDSDQRHVVALFDAATSSEPAWMPLALTLAGLCDVQPLAPRVAKLLEGPAHRYEALVALARMGHAPGRPALAALASEARQHRSPEARAAYLDVVAAAPGLADEQTLSSLLAETPASSGTGDSHVAWAISATRAPRATYENAASRTDVPAELTLQVTALTGYPDAVVRACAAMAQHDGPVSAAERDVLELALGGTPVEARQDAGSADAKSSALRALLLRVLRKAHVPIRNDADTCPWNADEILLSPTSRAVRLRAGAALPAGAPPLGAATLDVTHTVRQWLYIERAALAGITFGLRANDVFRRQRLALMIAQSVDELRD